MDIKIVKLKNTSQLTENCIKLDDDPLLVHKWRWEKLNNGDWVYSDAQIDAKAIADYFINHSTSFLHEIPLSSRHKTGKGRDQQAHVKRDMKKLIESDSPLPPCFPYHLFDAGNQFPSAHPTLTGGFRKFRDGPNTTNYSEMKWCDRRESGGWNSTNARPQQTNNLHRIWKTISSVENDWDYYWVRNPFTVPWQVKFRAIHRHRIIGDPNFRESDMPMFVDPDYPEWARVSVNRYFYDIGTGVAKTYSITKKEKPMAKEKKSILEAKDELIDSQHNHLQMIKKDYEEMKKERDEAKCQVLELTNNIENIKCGFKRMFQHVLGEESLQEVLKEMKE